MTNKQKLFVSEYLKDFNATQAAIRAGYSEDTAYSIGWENLRKPELKAEIKKYIDTALDNDSMSLKKRIVDELQSMAFGAGDEVSDGSRLKALELLGKYMALFTEKVEVSGKLGLYDDISDDEAKARIEELES